MKVSVITEGEYSDYRIVGVALTRELAEAVVAGDYNPDTGFSKRGRYADAYQIEEFEVLTWGDI